ncbi:unnamed protein product [Hermetia illucens]|uniref:Kazal-like domain-containing protein n=1 Tax=Hermetia illucens TaxID=343691 RepID=A0A7R8UGB3_HERIL|nr:four-domain proteases inhibitor-like [Hermetia illucens]CAD7080353.1 unnamed protein product [Hermetia illucens]
MKSIYAVTVLLFALILSAAAAPRCPIPCSREANPTCGFDGTCYRMFGSPCFMENYNCGAGSRFQIAPEEKCNIPELRCA